MLLFLIFLHISIYRFPLWNMTVKCFYYRLRHPPLSWYIQFCIFSIELIIIFGICNIIFRKTSQIKFPLWNNCFLVELMIEKVFFLLVFYVYVTNLSLSSLIQISFYYVYIHQIISSLSLSLSLFFFFY